MQNHQSFKTHSQARTRTGIQVGFAFFQQQGVTNSSCSPLNPTLPNESYFVYFQMRCFSPQPQTNIHVCKYTNLLWMKIAFLAECKCNPVQPETSWKSCLQGKGSPSYPAVNFLAIQRKTKTLAIGKPTDFGADLGSSLHRHGQLQSQFSGQRDGRKPASAVYTAVITTPPPHNA